MQIKRPRPSEFRGSANEACRYGGADEASAGGREKCGKCGKCGKCEKWKSGKVDNWTAVSQWKEELGAGERANKVAK